MVLPPLPMTPDRDEPRDFKNTPSSLANALPYAPGASPSTDRLRRASGARRCWQVSAVLVTLGVSVAALCLELPQRPSDARNNDSPTFINREFASPVGDFLLASAAKPGRDEAEVAPQPRSSAAEQHRFTKTPVNTDTRLAADHDDQIHIGELQPIGNSGWLTAVAQPTALAFGSLRSSLLAIPGGISAPLALALALLVACVYRRPLTRRVAELGHRARVDTHGDGNASRHFIRDAEMIGAAENMPRLAQALVERDAALAAAEERYRALVGQRLLFEGARHESAALLQLHAERASSMLDLPRAAEQMDEAEFILHGLDLAERLTGSSIAFLQWVDADQRTREAVRWSRRTLTGDCRGVAEPQCSVALTDLCAAVLRQRSVVLANDRTAMLANGLLPDAGGCRRLLAVPVVEGRLCRLLLAVGNKAAPFREWEIETLRLIGQDIWRIVNQRRAEVALRLAEQVFSASPSGICITDADKRIVSVNPALTKITGYSSDQMIGQTPRFFAPEHQRIGLYREMWNGITAEGIWHGEVWCRRLSGELFPAALTITAIKNDDGVLAHYIGSFHDITERKRSEEQIRFLVNHDALTGLPNRTLLDDRLRQAIAQSRRDESHTAVLFLDLDRFKLINDTLGHDTGDRLLARIGECLTAALRETETVARLGGDEFIVVIPALAEISRVVLVAQKVLEMVSSTQHLEERPLHVTPSIGISIYPNDGDDVSTLLRNAETAMYHAKECGRNNFQFFTPAMNLAVSERASIEHDLSIAIERGEFELFYQPQVDGRSGRRTGMEALIRWRHPQRGLVAPDRFIPVAEETGLIVAIGEWVLREACRQARLWHDAGQTDLRICVNLSARQLQQRDLCERVAVILGESGLLPATLEIELTESMLMVDPEAASTLLRKLAGLGIRLAIDDFGTGYSSLAYLKRFPVSRLKIDRSFVRDLSTDANDSAIVRAVVAMAESLKMEVIAEGVETVEQLHFLERHGCFEVQGYLFSQPRPAADFDHLPFKVPSPAGLTQLARRDDAAPQRP